MLIKPISLTSCPRKSEILFWTTCWKLQKLIAWRETAASSVVNKGSPPPPKKKIKCHDYGMLEKRQI